MTGGFSSSEKLALILCALLYRASWSPMASASPPFHVIPSARWITVVTSFVYLHIVNSYKALFEIEYVFITLSCLFSVAHHNCCIVRCYFDHRDVSQQAGRFHALVNIDYLSESFSCLYHALRWKAVFLSMFYSSSTTSSKQRERENHDLGMQSSHRCSTLQELCTIAWIHQVIPLR